MIVCTRCGFHNEDTDTFCGSCAGFLEWSGEVVAEAQEPAPPAEPEAAPAAEPEPRRLHGTRKGSHRDRREGGGRRD